MAKSQNFFSTQYVLTSYIRDPENNPGPAGIEQRRLRIYRNLLYNNVEKFLSNTYPVLKKVLSDHWHVVIQDYFATHLSQTPLFTEMPREFLKYLEQERIHHPQDPAFMLELAHYEWVELALSIQDKTMDAANISPNGNLPDDIPVISPLAWLLSYHFPVHKIRPDFQPQSPSDTLTHLLVYRDLDYEVRFIEANQVTARLVQLVIENKYKTNLEMLKQIAHEIGHTQPNIVIKGGLDILTDLKSRNIILGSLVKNKACKN